MEKYSRNENEAFEFWNNLGFLQPVSENNKKKVAVIFDQIVNWINSPEFPDVLKNIPNIDVSVIIIPLYIRIINQLEKIVDFNTFKKCVFKHFKTTKDYVDRMKNTTQNVDYEAEICAILGDNIIKDLKK